MVPFENMTSEHNNSIIENVLNEIEAIEQRITFIRPDCRVNVYPDENSIDMILKYIILENGLVGKYQQKIST